MINIIHTIFVDRSQGSLAKLEGDSADNDTQLTKLDVVLTFQLEVSINVLNFNCYCKKCEQQSYFITVYKTILFLMFYLISFTKATMYKHIITNYYTCIIISPKSH